MGEPVPDELLLPCLGAMDHILMFYDTLEECAASCLPDDCPPWTAHYCEPPTEWDGICIFGCEDDPGCRFNPGGWWDCVCSCYFAYSTCIPL